jgi:hypothetical protein
MNFGPSSNGNIVTFGYSPNNQINFSRIPSTIPTLTELANLELWLDANDGVFNSLTVDTPATNDQTVARWNNLVSGKPNLSQSNASLQPVFKSSVNGHKAVFFNGDVLYSSGFSNFSFEYSYYLVSTDLGAQSGSLAVAIRLGSSSLANRGLFGANASFIGASNGTSRFSTISPTAAPVNIWSARFNIGSPNGNIVTVGSKKTYQTLVDIGGLSANRTDILLGASSSSGTTQITSNYSEVLVYRAFHDEATANQIIDYLAAKWSITL